MKVRMQLSKSKISGYSSFRKILEKEGIPGFYKGVVSPILGTAPVVAVLFAVNDQSQSVLKEYRLKPVIKDFYCGCIAGAFVSVLVSPIDLLKIKKQAKSGRNLSYAQIISSIYHKSGLTGIYKGYTPTLLRSVGPNGAYFMTNSYLQRTLDVSHEKNSNFQVYWKKILSGGIAGQVFWITNYPFDVLKSHMQYSTDPKITLRQSFKHLYKTRGIGHFYKGLGVTVLRAFPVNAINFTIYEAVSKRFSPDSP